MPSSQRLIDYLPAIYHGDPFLADFLQAFDEVLLGTGNPAQPGIEETIANIPRYFDPQQAPATLPDQDFLSWLAGWTAFSLRSDLSPVLQRDFIAQVIPLYQRRGTLDNLIKLLQIFTSGKPIVTESSTVPHFFLVEVRLSTSELVELGKQTNIAKALIDLEKPAHTTYDLILITTGGIQVGKTSTVGVNTLIGVLQNPKS